MIPARRLAALLLFLPALAVAQVRRDSVPADSARRDTIRLSPPDSIAARLLAKPGHTATRYEGEVVTFDAITKAMAISASAGRAAIVEREGQRVVTDSLILYSDRTRSVNVRGRSFEIVPGGGQAPISGTGTASYNLSERSGRLTNATITVEESGQRWFIESAIAKTVLGDSTRGIGPRYYGLGGSLTSCEDSIPDYYFRLREVKRTQRTLVARPAVLYIRDIPVMWLPFVFQDIRPGRRSGILPPRAGASDIVRNNPNYRRHIENIGYYWAFSDYADMAMWADWRSSAGADSIDPGWVQLNGQWNYNWLSRFLSGSLALSQMRERDGDSRLAVTWLHNQRFTADRRIMASINYTTSTNLQRRNTFNPYQAIGTILSTITLADKVGPFSLQLGGTQRQYPGRSQVDRAAPSLTLTSAPLSLGEWLVWTPSLNFEESSSLNIDQPGTFVTQFIGGPNGELIRVDTLDRNEFTRGIRIGSPLRIFGMDFSQNLSIRDRLLDYPEEKIVYPGADSSRKETRVFRQTFSTEIDWNPSFSLPPLFNNRFKLTPSVTLGNVDPGPYWIRNDLSGGKWVSQTKRLSYGLSAQPTIFGMFPGFGPFSRLRHTVSPGFSYSYAPGKAVSDEYLAARGFFSDGYLGALPQSVVSMSLSQTIEAKAKAPLDSSGADEGGAKLKLLGMQFSSLGYDFERARVTRRKLAGLTTESFNTSFSSDLLPGFGLSVNYSLFQGSLLSDTAQFRPFLTNISSNISFSQGQNPFAVLTRLFGRAVTERSPAAVSTTPSSQERALERRTASQPVAGQASRGMQFLAPPTQGWEASFNFSTSRSRRPIGDRVIEYDPKIRCEPFRLVNPFAYDDCLRSPSLALPIPPTTVGAPLVHMPSQTSLSSDLRFQLTQKWSASWNTSYDFEERQFASQVVGLQRDLHDWRAIFSFTHSPNGNFAFNFFIHLKAQPELKLDYNRATVRSQ